MLAARLHGPHDLRVEHVPRPPLPPPGQALIEVRATGICGSDLHLFEDGRIGDTEVKTPLVIGHEFAGVVAAVGAGARDSNHEPLSLGTRVAVDPAQPCGHCESCDHGHPNLCGHLAFCGNHPYGGSLCEQLLMPARSCFPVPPALNHEEAALLEPLGVAIHAVDFAKLRVAQSVAVLGAGPIGLLILQVARLAGADPVYVTDRLAWRLKLAEQWGGVPIHAGRRDAVRQVLKETHGRGVDVAIEAAWAEDSVAEAAEMLRLGGRLVIVGISGKNQLSLTASVARRKGLTIILSRRMKHTYPRAIRLAASGRVDLGGLVSHRFPLKNARAAFKLNAAYRDNVVKVMITG